MRPGPIALVPILLACIALVLPRSAFAGTFDVSSFYLSCPTTTVTEGDSVTVVMRWGTSGGRVTVVAHIHTEPIGTAPIRADGTDYVNKGGAQQTTNYDEAENAYMNITVATREDSVPEYDETFQVSFGPPNDVFNPDHADRDNKCTITIEDDDVPYVTDVSVTSRPRVGDTYGRSEANDVQVTFD